MSSTPDPTSPDPTSPDPLDLSSAGTAGTDPTDETSSATPPVDRAPLSEVPGNGEPLGETPAAAGLNGEPTLDPVVEVPPAQGRPARTTAYTHAMRETDLRAVYALAGFTDVAVGAVRKTVTESQRWAAQRLSELRYRREALAQQVEEVSKITEDLPEDAAAAAHAAKTKAAELQEHATHAYADLADRGQRVLHDVRNDVAERIDPAFDKIQERIDAARRAIKARAAAAAETSGDEVATQPAAEEGVPTTVPGTSQAGSGPLSEDVVEVEVTEVEAPGTATGDPTPRD